MTDNGNWRLVFRFDGADAERVDYVDYHQESIMSRVFDPPHPGEVLQEYLPESTSVTEAAQKLADLWLGMQMQYDLWQAKQRPPKGVQKWAA